MDAGAGPDPVPEPAEEYDGFGMQARLFAFVGTFFTVVSLGYGFWTYEWAGTTMLALASGLAFTVGAYVGWNLNGSPAAGAGHRIGEEPWFPAASGWPFAVALGMVLVGNGLLLGLWMLLPASAFLAFGLAGFIRQSRYRT